MKTGAILEFTRKVYQVEIQIEGMVKPIQLTPERAKEIAADLLAKAETAERLQMGQREKLLIRRCEVCGQVITSGTCRPGKCSRSEEVQVKKGNVNGS